MNILVISERLPGRVGGGAARQYNLIRTLSPKHEFTVAAYAYPADLTNLPALQPYVRRAETIELEVPVLKQRPGLYWWLNGWRRALLDPNPLRGRLPRAGDMRRLVTRLLAEHCFDLIQVHQTYLASLVPQTDVPKLLDMHDILSDHEYRVAKAKTKWTHRFAAWAEWKKTQSLERRTARRFPVCVTTSDSDRDSLLRIAPHLRTVVVPNGVDLDYFRPQPAPVTGTDLVFVGSMNYQPNSDGIAWFCEAVLPIIREHVPEAHLYVVGFQPPPEIQALDRDPAVTVTGYVDDVRPYLASSAVVVVPIRLGSGTRLKILDAWAMGRPVVSTTLGAEGLGAADSENIVLADEPSEFATHVVRLLDDEQRRFTLGQAGRRFVERNYSWSAVGAQMEIAYKWATSTRAASR